MRALIFRFVFIIRMHQIHQISDEPNARSYFHNSLDFHVLLRGDKQLFASASCSSQSRQSKNTFSPSPSRRLAPSAKRSMINYLSTILIADAEKEHYKMHMKKGVNFIVAGENENEINFRFY